MCHNKLRAHTTLYCKSSRSTLGIHHRLLDLCQPWRVWYRIDGRHCCSVPCTWTEWSLYLLPKLQAASPVLTWWAKRTQFAFLEGVCRSIWSRIWWSTTLARCNRLICYILCHINTHYYVLFHTWGFKLDFIAEGDQSILEVHRLDLAINGHACLQLFSLSSVLLALALIAWPEQLQGAAMLRLLWTSAFRAYPSPEGFGDKALARHHLGYPIHLVCWPWDLSRQDHTLC